MLTCAQASAPVRKGEKGGAGDRGTSSPCSAGRVPHREILPISTTPTPAPAGGGTGFFLGMIERKRPFYLGAKVCIPLSCGMPGWRGWVPAGGPGRVWGG